MIRTISNDPSFDEWATRLVTEAVNHRHAVWTIGDLMIEGLNRFDEPRVWTAAEGTGMTPETLTNYKSLAKSFPRGKRRLNLGVSIHEVVRTLDDAARTAALDLVERHELTREALRERVKAYKGGDLAALNSDWKPPHKVIEVEEPHAGVIDEDKPVFDSGAFGEAVEAERGERERADFTASDANQDVLNACRAVEKIDIRMVDPERLSRDAIKAAIVRLRELEDIKARYDARRQDIKTHYDAWRTHSAPDAVSAEACARKGGDAASLPASPPDNSNRSAGIDASVVTSPAGRGADESPAINSNLAGGHSARAGSASSLHAATTVAPGTIPPGDMTAAGTGGEGDGLPAPRTPELSGEPDLPSFLDRRTQHGA